MTVHHSLEYYLRIGYLPILDRYRLKDINSEYGCFIGLDVCFPLYKVLEMDAQSLEGTWNEVNDYVANAFRIITEEYGEELGIEEEEKLRDVDKEIIHEIEYQLKKYLPLLAILFILYQLVMTKMKNLFMLEKLPQKHTASQVVIVLD